METKPYEGRMKKTVIIKLSGEDIGSRTSADIFDDSHISNIISQICNVVDSGLQVALVIGGGNIWRAKTHNQGIDRVKSDQMGMLATVINGLYLAEMFRLKNQPAAVMTPHGIHATTLDYNRDDARRLLAAGHVLICAGGTGHPFFSTDTAVALRAAELGVDMILFAKSGTDGVYSADPKDGQPGRKYKSLSYAMAIKNNYTVADMSAFCLAQDADIPSLVFALSTPQSITLACNHPNTGSLNGTYMAREAREEFYGN